MSGQKIRLLSLDDLDHRTIAAKQVKETISAIESDLGGADNITVAKRQIVESAAITSAILRTWGAAGLLASKSTWLCSARSQRRLYESVGLEFRAKDITPSIDQIAQEIEASKNDK
jgi:hypothetical protein